MRFNKIIAFLFVCVITTVLLSGCGQNLTEEEAAALAEEQKRAQYAQEEIDTGTRRLTSENLSDAEVVLKDFVTAIQTNDVAGVAKAISVPNVFAENNLYGWIIANDYEVFFDTPLENIRVRSTKEGSLTELDVWINTDITAEPEKYKVEFTGGQWTIIPPYGIAEDYIFTAPSKNLSCNGVSLEQYAVAADATGYNWTFEIPRFPILEESPIFKIKTNLGEFDGKLFTTPNSNMILACLTDEQKAEFENALEMTLNTAYQMLKSGTDATQMTSVLLSETILQGCFPDNPEEMQRLKSDYQLFNSVSVYEDDIKAGLPQEYVYRLAGEDGIILDTKLSIDTQIGESRKKASFTLQNFGGTWKIVSVNTESEINPFTDFSTYNPAW